MKGLVVFGPERSGGALLISLLNAHPSIFCDGEAFHSRLWRTWRRPLRPVVQRFPLPYLSYRQLIARRRHHAEVYGFKLLPSHAPDPLRMTAGLHAHGWSLLYLERLSTFAQTISYIVASHSRRWHGSAGRAEPDLAPFAVDPGFFLARMYATEEKTQRCRGVVARTPHLSIVYEHDLASPDRWNTTVQRICAYVGIEPSVTAVNTQLKKPWTRPYSELISNYAELVEWARQHGYDV